MIKIHRLKLILTSVIAAVVLLASCSQSSSTKTTSNNDDMVLAQAYNCVAEESWFTSPSMPIEVKKSDNGESNFCDFYQFSWQAFAYLMAPSTNDNQMRNIEDPSQFPILEVNDKGQPLNSCDKTIEGHTLLIRTDKPMDGDTPFNIPERINQAGSASTIYDTQGNIVYYNIRFDRNSCNAEQIGRMENFPSGTTELKTAWREITTNDANDYFTMEAKVGSQTDTQLLGLIGMHVAVATTDHPEFVWATFEHKLNAPDCTQAVADVDWSFSSSQCTQALISGDATKISACSYNNPNSQTNPSRITGKPTNICRVNPYGSTPGDPNYAENVGDITTLNSNVQPYLTGDFAVLKNYFNVGALWVSDITIDSTKDNQRGSLHLANTVAETDFQGAFSGHGKDLNCFVCHGYTAGGMNTTSGKLSHVFDDIVVGLGACVDVRAATLISSNVQAQATCPKTCTGASKNFDWNGNWTNQGYPMSVCGCCGSSQ